MAVQQPQEPPWDDMRRFKQCCAQCYQNYEGAAAARCCRQCRDAFHVFGGAKKGKYKVKLPVLFEEY